MTMLSFNTDGVAPTSEQIEALERNLGYNLPTDFRDYLQNNKLNVPSGNSFPTGTHNRSGIDRFVEFEKILEAHAYLSQHNQSELLPFAEDGLGNYICLSLNTGGDTSAVYFWDHETNASVKVAENLPMLLSKLTVLEPDLEFIKSKYGVTMTEDGRKLLEALKNK